ncbi:hypothetical protein LGQ02_02310 [Bacillus shivajii]|uniref:hypothetical protein n=1 Tax=Bacillus shivajii TaxID=1983719 RepID=UPI001CFB6F94|nr:hypothetical protein [Bacillus shivajii]UCZ53653.1 hypothetical protein LGQ02_02310 [Bacillus shivajii]
MRHFAFFIFFMLFILSACQENETPTEKNTFPFDHIHEKFTYHPFHYPGEWDIVALSANVEHKYQDFEQPENHGYSEVPHRYSFTFGRKAPENEVQEEALHQFNERNALEGKTVRQVYYHSYFDYYAHLSIGQDGFTRLISDFAETEEWEIEGESFLVLNRDHQWVINRYKDGVYYDLLITAEAGITSPEQTRELIKVIFIEA